MHLGKAIRMERIFNRDTGRTIVVPLDHGVSVGPIKGLIDMRETLSHIAEGGANAVLMHKGLVRCGHRRRGPDIGLIVHLSASTSLSPFPNAKTLTGTVEEAIRLGADAVSVHVNLGDETERDMLKDVGRVSARANEWGMPFLAMVYARGSKVKNEYDSEVVAHCARVGLELGADVVKVPYTGDVDTFHRVVEGCCIPVVIAGGPKMDSLRDLLQMVADSVKAGGAGLSMGRNIFQADNPRTLVRALHGIVHNGLSVDAAMDVAGG
ncbi:MAG: 2-amino-3,7-dideoxy-D-threo-hept-6-ulosonate synthase [Thermodesulfobacteriota bacterium]|nr:2-amino-3,7-dideoxy-D-threo-hept-6-ulosonate synthase [Thermodesulfobacteriota bacterium]